MLSAPISFSTELCVLGPFLVATTPTGICAVLFGEDTAALYWGAFMSGGAWQSSPSQCISTKRVAFHSLLQKLR